MLHVICTRLRPGHLSARVRDSSWRSEEIVKKSRIAPLNVVIIIIIIIIVIIIIKTQNTMHTLCCVSLVSTRKEER